MHSLFEGRVSILSVVIEDMTSKDNNKRPHLISTRHTSTFMNDSHGDGDPKLAIPSEGP